jgi:hypothetical protein
LRKQRTIALTMAATAHDAAGNKASARQNIRLRR